MWSTYQLSHRSPALHQIHPDLHLRLFALSPCDDVRKNVHLPNWQHRWTSHSSSLILQSHGNSFITCFGGKMVGWCLHHLPWKKKKSLFTDEKKLETAENNHDSGSSSSFFLSHQLFWFNVRFSNRVTGREMSLSPRPEFHFSSYGRNLFLRKKGILKKEV